MGRTAQVGENAVMISLPSTVSIVMKKGALRPDREGLEHLVHRLERGRTANLRE
jgi:hypothetical protein